MSVNIERKGARAAILALSLSLGMLLVACSSGPKQKEPKTLAKAPFCGKKSYGENKRGNFDEIDVRPQHLNGGADEDAANSGKILTKDRPLGVPPEITRIQRGLLTQFVGAVTKDGVTVWSGIDLDRSMAITVKRRIYDRRAFLMREFDDPEFPVEDHGAVFARKYTSNGRIEEEVIWSWHVDTTELERFVCASNEEWNLKAPRRLGALDNEQDPMLDGTQVFYLIDRRTAIDRKTQAETTYGYSKSIAQLDGELYDAVSNILSHAPQGPSSW